jgi:predicted metal-dependent hydrolase
MAGKPNSIDMWASLEFLESMDTRIKSWYLQLSKQGWRFYITEQSRGRCQWGYRTCTIPAWVLAFPKEKQTWYLSHEMAHAFAGWEAKHGPVFMDWLKKICPADCIHYELGYKPRNAMAAGIGKPKKEIEDLL